MIELFPYFKQHIFFFFNGCKLAIENCLENGVMVMVVADGKLKQMFLLVISG